MIIQSRDAPNSSEIFMRELSPGLLAFVSEPYLAEAQDDATVLAIMAQEMWIEIH